MGNKPTPLQNHPTPHIRENLDRGVIFVTLTKSLDTVDYIDKH